jgi:hypothetical protein
MDTNCRICGYFFNYPIWDKDGASPSYEICPCCGAEAGVDDYKLAVIREYRNKWIMERGAIWFKPGIKPLDWDFFSQIKGVPEMWI